MPTYCCKIGCTSTEDKITKTQEVAFRANTGNIIRARIYWCEEHEPTCILEDFTQVDLLKNMGGCY